MLPGRRHGAVVSYIRRAFCLDCRVASALPLCSVRCSWYPCLEPCGPAGGEQVGTNTLQDPCLQQQVVRAPIITGQALIFLAGGHVAAGTGQECQLDLGSPEEEPWLCISCSAVPCGMQGSSKRLKPAKAGQGRLSKDGCPPVSRSLRLLLCVSNDNSSSQLAV